MKLAKNKFLVIDENMGLCLYIQVFYNFLFKKISNFHNSCAEGNFFVLQSCEAKIALWPMGHPQGLYVLTSVWVQHTPSAG